MAKTEVAIDIEEGDAIVLDITNRIMHIARPTTDGAITALTISIRSHDAMLDIYNLLRDHKSSYKYSSLRLR